MMRRCVVIVIVFHALVENAIVAEVTLCAIETGGREREEKKKTNGK